MLNVRLALAPALAGPLAGEVNFSIAYRRYRLPFRQPVRTAHGLWAERDGLLLRLEAEDGGHGFGDVTPIPWFGTETVEEAEALVGSLGATTTKEVLQALPPGVGCVRSAVEAALAAFTGPDSTGALSASWVEKSAWPVAALLPAGRLALAAVGPKAELGFRTFKWKVGAGDLADELALLDDLIAELPEGSKIRLDANGAWDRRQAERWLERSADRPVEFIEQPCLAPLTASAKEKGRVDDTLIGLAHDYPTPLALDESVISNSDVDAWLARGWPDIFVIKTALFGGVGGTLERLRQAKAPVVFSSALETAVGAKAALRRAFQYPGERRALGFGVWPLYQDGRFDGPQLTPFIRPRDVQAMDEEAAWNALS